MFFNIYAVRTILKPYIFQEHPNFIMAIINFLYSIIILPVETVLQWLYNLITYFFNSNDIIFGIAGLSLAVNILTLPLYNLAEAQQKKQKEIERRLEDAVQRIKKAFKGDEQLMVLSTLYRQNNYSPLSAFKNSLTVLIEIPFFIAAFHFLSNLDALRGVSLFGINDLSLPDSLIRFEHNSRTISINVLPFFMTALNLLSGIIYAEKSNLKDKIQFSATSVIFLFLLYNSPSGLVIYWILNNLFSLCKNLIQKRLCPKIVLLLRLSHSKSAQQHFIHSGFESLNHHISCMSTFFSHSLRKASSPDKSIFLLFVLSGLALTLLYGLVIPSQIIQSNPADFSYLGNTKSPFNFILQSFLMFSGMYFLWPLMIFHLSPEKFKKIEAAFLFVILICSLLNVYVLKPYYGTISTSFILPFPKTLKNHLLLYSASSVLAVISFSGLFVFLRKRNKIRFLSYSSAILALSFVFMSLINFRTISTRFKDCKPRKTRQASSKADAEFEKIYHLSNTRNNVIVIFLDRAINSFFPKIIEQNPELKESFSGFTYFPNTLSFGNHTVIASPAMCGGYEYTPENLNLRIQDTLKKKHNEALMVMPRLFYEAGFKIAVSNSPVPNYSTDYTGLPYSEFPEMKIYDTYGKYSAKFLEENKISDYTTPFYREKNCYKQIRNFSVLEGLFPPVRSLFYKVNIEYSKRIEYFFWDTLSSLHYLSEQSDFSSDSPTFTFIGNDLTHEPYILRDNYSLYNKSSTYEDEHYFVNRLAMKKIAAFLDFLKKNKAYDNTRIIIVSDHGFPLELEGAENFIDRKRPFTYNPLLLFKDFNAAGEIITDKSLMTNADTLFLAKQDLKVSNVNPYTGKEFIQEKDAPIRVHEVIKSENDASLLKNKRIFTLRNNLTWIVSGEVLNGRNWTNGSKTSDSKSKNLK